MNFKKRITSIVLSFSIILSSVTPVLALNAKSGTEIVASCSTDTIVKGTKSQDKTNIIDPEQESSFYESSDYFENSSVYNVKSNTEAMKRRNEYEKLSKNIVEQAKREKSFYSTTLNSGKDEAFLKKVKNNEEIYKKYANLLMNQKNLSEKEQKAMIEAKKFLSGEKIESSSKYSKDIYGNVPKILPSSITAYCINITDSSGAEYKVHEDQIKIPESDIYYFRGNPEAKIRMPGSNTFKFDSSKVHNILFSVIISSMNGYKVMVQDYIKTRNNRFKSLYTNVKDKNRRKELQKRYENYQETFDLSMKIGDRRKIKTKMKPENIILRSAFTIPNKKVREDSLNKIFNDKRLYYNPNNKSLEKDFSKNQDYIYVYKYVPHVYRRRANTPEGIVYPPFEKELKELGNWDTPGYVPNKCRDAEYFNYFYEIDIADGYYDGYISSAQKGWEKLPKDLKEKIMLAAYCNPSNDDDGKGHLGFKNKGMNFNGLDISPYTNTDLFKEPLRTDLLRNMGLFNTNPFANMFPLFRTARTVSASAAIQDNNAIVYMGNKHLNKLNKQQLMKATPYKKGDRSRIKYVLIDKETGSIVDEKLTEHGKSHTFKVNKKGDYIVKAYTKARVERADYYDYEYCDYLIDAPSGFIIYSNVTRKAETKNTVTDDEWVELSVNFKHGTQNHNPIERIE